MAYKNLFGILLLSAGLIVSSCHEKDQKKDNNSDRTDTSVVRDIPGRFEDVDRRKRIENLLKKLEITSMKNGVDEVQYRIWIDCDIRDTQNIIVIGKVNAEWKATFYSYKLHLNEDGSIKSLKKQTEDKLPISGWPNFTKALIATGIDSLEDYEKLPSRGYALPTDAKAVTVEIGSPKKYRLYQYPQLDMNKQNTNGPAQLEKIIKLIEEEFSYKRPCQ